MKKIIFAFLALSLIVFAGCKPDDPNKPDGPTGELRFLNENPLKMTKSTSKVLSLEGARFSEVDLTCSDENIVIVSPQGVATAGRTEGTVTVTATLKSNSSVTASITIEVVDYYKNVQFVQAVSMSTSNPWQTERYVIYRVRRYRGEEIPDGDDAKLTANETYKDQDTSTVLGHYWPEKGEWLYLMDYTRDDGTPAKLGLFADSVATGRMWILPANAYFVDNSFTCTDVAAVAEFTETYVFDSKYHYTLGAREIVDDVLAYDVYRKPGTDPKPWPCTYQGAHFNAENYCAYWQERLIEKNPDVSEEDYPFYQMYDGQMHLYVMDENGDLGAYYFGYPVTREDGESGIEFAKDESADAIGYAVPAYSFDVMLFSDYTMAGLVTEPVTGDDGETYLTWADPIQIAPMVPYTYNKGTYPASAPRRQSVDRLTEQKPELRRAAEVRMNVNATVGSTLMMFMEQNSKH